jgi:hypothetical protein
MNKYIFASLTLFGISGAADAAMGGLEAHVSGEDRLQIAAVNDYRLFNNNADTQGPGPEGKNIRAGLFKAKGGSASSFNPVYIAEENLLPGLQTMTLTGLQKGSGVNLAATDDTSGHWSGVGKTDASGSVRSVPILSAVWLFGSGFVGLIGISKKILAESLLAKNGS